ncbi:cupin domain-containing protein [Thermoflexibacter ruber]|uniref:Cupin domain protein n=1 Tax=Thermoflexibacter ruber TaxID=1003 RepID=A0A1I2IE75_9BACT|nr:cupin domain-containing protein [Thermoflexibacter ruber]SFF40524.1 Cupin domain protein [Thermoflexibacter ruber]
MNRRIYNPLQKDYVTFLKTSEETKGEFTLLEVELANGGGVGLHYHKTYSEKFTCLEGKVQVQLNNQLYTLSEGDSATANKLVNHLFQNRSGQSCKFMVEIVPANRGFEQALQIAYGLARDGKCGKKGIPKNPFILSWLFVLSESNLRGWRSLFEPMLRFQALIARLFQIDQQLAKKYVKF